MTDNITDEDIEHWRTLIVVHKRRLRVLEGKVAKYGELRAPADILIEIEDTKKEIADLEQKIRRRITNTNDSGRLYTDEEIDTIYDLMTEIWKQEDSIESVEKYIKRLQEGKLHVMPIISDKIRFSWLSVVYAFSAVAMLMGGFITRDGYLVIFAVIMAVGSILRIYFDPMGWSQITQSQKLIDTYRSNIESLKEQIERMRGKQPPN